MLLEYPTEITIDALDKSNPTLKNPAVARCCNAWKDAYRAKFEEDEFEAFAASAAAEAFRAAMPPLTSRESCRDFIACVAQGMLLGAIAEKNAGKLLYAAQIALSSAAAVDAKSQTSSIARKKNTGHQPKSGGKR